ncbi:MAG: C1 family peptidase [Methanothrix sp.]|nr:C1 family peptidase [Methanothrix sp.]
MLTLPTKMDWNNLNGKKWTTELRSQGSAKTCVAFGVLAALETLLKIHYYNDPDQSLDLSEGRIWNCGHRWAAKGYPDGDCSDWKDDTKVATEDAWTIEPPLRYLKKFGVASAIEEYDNFWPDKCKCAASSPNTKIKSYQMISITGTGNADDWIVPLKKKLVMYGPVIAEYSLSQYGSHCVAIVGYDDSLRRFLLKDSLDNPNPFISYDGPIPKTHSIEVYKPRLNINIPGISGPSELSLKVVKTASAYTGNLAEVDPTVLPNLQSNFNASYDSAGGWISISPEVVGGIIALPLHLAVPPGSYDISVAIPSHIYFGSVVIGTPVSDIPIEITLQEQPDPQQLTAPQHPSLSFNAVNNMIAASWNAALECAHYSSFKAHIRVQDYQDNSLLIEKHDLAIACENGIISSEISISEILPQYAGKLCKVEVRYDNLGQLSDWSESVGIALVTPYANIIRMENGINSIFIQIDFGAAGYVETQIYDGENRINLDPSDTLTILGNAVDYPLSIKVENGKEYQYEGDWLIDPNIATFRPGISRGTIILKISASRLNVGRSYNVKVRVKDDHFIGPFAEQQITWQPVSYDPTWFLEEPTYNPHWISPNYSKAQRK